MRLSLLLLVFCPRLLSAGDTADEAAGVEEARRLAARYFTVLAAKNLDALMALWSPKAPDRARHEKAMRRLFDQTGALTCKSVRIVRARADERSAQVRVRAELTGDDKHTGKPHRDLGRLDHVLVLHREDGVWRVQRHLPTDRELGRALAEAETPEQRRRLLEADGDLASPELVLTLLQQGDAESRAGRFNRAERLQEAAGTLADKLDDKLSRARRDLFRGLSRQRQGRYEEALALCRRAASAFRAAGRRDEEAAALLDVGITCRLMGRPADALAPLRSSLDLVTELGDRGRMAVTLNELGITLAALGRHDEARRQFEQALPIVRQRKEPADEAAILDGLGIVLAAVGRNEEALRHFLDSLAIRRRLHDRPAEALLLDKIGYTYRRMGRYTDAVHCFQEFLAVQRERRDPAGETLALNRLGGACRLTGRYAEAMRCYEELLPRQREAGDRLGAAGTLNNLGIVCRSMGRYADALRYLRDSLKAARELGDRPGEARTLNNLGTVYAQTGQYAQALRQYQDSLRLKESLHDEAGQAVTLDNLANVYEMAGLYADALRQHETSLKIMRRLGDRHGEARALTNLGNCCARLGRYPEALRHQETSLKIVRELGDRHLEAQLLSRIGLLYPDIASAGDERAFERAVESQRAALKLAQSLGAAETAFHCHENLGAIHESRKEWRQAADAHTEAVGLLEQLRTQAGEASLRIGLLARHEAAYRRLAGCLLKLDRPAEAFAAVERAKARSLMDVLNRSGRLDVRKGMTDEQLRQERRFQDRLAALAVEQETLHSRKADRPRQDALAGELAEARRDYEAFRRDLFLHSADQRLYRAEFEPAKLTEIYRDLFVAHPRLVLLSYLVVDKTTWLFVVTSAAKPGESVRLTVHEIAVEEEELFGEVKQFRDNCANPGGGTPTGETLYRLLAPAEDALAGASEVVIVPDGPLHELPFHALKDGEDGECLLQRCAVSYAPSVTALLAMTRTGGRRREKAGGTLLALGISDFDGRETRLPAAEREAEAVARLSGGAASVLLGRAATKANLRKAWAGRRYLHLATHGRLDEASPLYSAVVLTSSGGRDEGVLYAEDLLREELTAELVVLSACKTGLGSQVRGEGLLGMTWAWFVAGVPATVASQWSVADDSTARLMQVFYEQLKGGASKAEALRQAQLVLLKDRKTRHPYFWAPFILTGDPW